MKKDKIFTCIGTMSGTSFDGVDAALIRTDGNNFIEYINSEFIPYKKKERELFNASIFKNYYKLINLINNTHLKVIKSLLIKNKKKYKKIDIIGLHGQTFFHKPEEKWSWQYINTKIFLNTFKTNIISDFRLNDINYGGEGAPLVPIYHSKLAKKIIKKSSLAIVNIGGVCNTTIVNRDGTFLGYDIGPGNGPIDKIMLQKFNKDFDKDGSFSIKGNPNNTICEEIISDISKLSKKTSYDRMELDLICINKTKGLTPFDALATIVKSVAKLIHIKLSKYNLSKIILVGGGRKNKNLVNLLKESFTEDVILAEDIGWDGDSLEAQAFAYLAARSYLGLNITFPSTTGINVPKSGGVLHVF